VAGWWFFLHTPVSSNYEADLWDQASYLSKRFSEDINTLMNDQIGN
jgi:hypothetical protein